MYRIGRARLYAAIIITALLECTLLNIINIGGMRPDLILILVIFIGLYAELGEALEAGAVAGILKGIMTTGPVGINVAILTLCALFAHYCRNKLYRESLLTQIILTLLLAAIVNVLGLFAAVLMDDADIIIKSGLWHTSVFPVVKASLYTSFFGPPAFLLFKHIFKMRKAGS